MSSLLSYMLIVVSVGGHKLLDGTDIGGVFPSMQSGNWSTLMQSAIVATTNNDVGLREQ